MTAWRPCRSLIALLGLKDQLSLYQLVDRQVCERTALEALASFEELRKVHSNPFRVHVPHGRDRLHYDSLLLASAPMHLDA